MSTATLAPVANRRGAHRLRTISYDDLSQCLNWAGTIPIYVYNAAEDLWVPVIALSINPPMPWGKEHKEQWMAIPVVDGRRRDEAFAHVRYRAGRSELSEQLQDVRVGGAK